MLGFCPADTSIGGPSAAAAIANRLHVARARAITTLEETGHGEGTETLEQGSTQAEGEQG